MGKFGHYFVKKVTSYSSLFGSRDGLADFACRWQKPGDELHTNTPSMTYPANSRRDEFYRYAEINVMKGDHIRLQYITLSYNFSAKALSKYLPASCNLYVNMNNMGIIWRANDQHIDPDNYNQGIPTPKNIVFGLNADF